jgi:hypothetical protein
MMPISRKSALAIVACGLFSAVAVAKPIMTDQTRRADCVLAVDGTRYIDGPCGFTPIDTDGSFIVTSKRNSSLFAYVNMNGDGSAQGSWTGPGGASHAHEDLGQLSHNGGCWSNATAKVCAWRPGEKRVGL